MGHGLLCKVFEDMPGDSGSGHFLYGVVLGLSCSFLSTNLLPLHCEPEVILGPLLDPVDGVEEEHVTT